MKGRCALVHVWVYWHLVTKGVVPWCLAWIEDHGGIVVGCHVRGHMEAYKDIIKG